MRKKEKKNLFKTVLGTLLISLPILSMALKNNNHIDTVEMEVLKNDSIVITKQQQTANPKDSIKTELITEVENYIYNNFPKTNRAIPNSLVSNALSEDIDLIFMMAQTQIETHFGTLGIGKETSKRSLFGVMSRKYSSYDKAISDYISILKKHYLIEGKRTEQHLMNKYTTKGGTRYAANPNYESELKSTYKKINSKTNIRKLQIKYKELENFQTNYTAKAEE